jgi:hypothetical protein
MRSSRSHQDAKIAKEKPGEKMKAINRRLDLLLNELSFFSCSSFNRLNFSCLIYLGVLGDLAAMSFVLMLRPSTG